MAPKQGNEILTRAEGDLESGSIERSCLTPALNPEPMKTTQLINRNENLLPPFASIGGESPPSVSTEENLLLLLLPLEENLLPPSASIGGESPASFSFHWRCFCFAFYLLVLGL